MAVNGEEKKPTREMAIKVASRPRLSASSSGARPTLPSAIETSGNDSSETASPHGRLAVDPVR
jgi:hypothetical protein